MGIRGLIFVCIGILCENKYWHEVLSHQVQGPLGRLVDSNVNVPIPQIIKYEQPSPQREYYRPEYKQQQENLKQLLNEQQPKHQELHVAPWQQHQHQQQLQHQSEQRQRHQVVLVFPAHRGDHKEVLQSRPNLVTLFPSDNKNENSLRNRNIKVQIQRTKAPPGQRQVAKNGFIEKPSVVRSQPATVSEPSIVKNTSDQNLLNTDTKQLETVEFSLTEDLSEMNKDQSGSLPTTQKVFEDLIITKKLDIRTLKTAVG